MIPMTQHGGMPRREGLMPELLTISLCYGFALVILTTGMVVWCRGEIRALERRDTDA
jgi:hypothetical protein